MLNENHISFKSKKIEILKLFWNKEKKVPDKL